MAKKQITLLTVGSLFKVMEKLLKEKGNGGRAGSHRNAAVGAHGQKV